MSSLEIKLKQEIKSYVIDSLVENYFYDEATARRLVEESFFAKLLKEDPEYVCHYDIEYWAKRIKDQNDKLRELVLV